MIKTPMEGKSNVEQIRCKRGPRAVCRLMRYKANELQRSLL